jgi:hypothetical protein
VTPISIVHIEHNDFAAPQQRSLQQLPDEHWLLVEPVPNVGPGLPDQSVALSEIVGQRPFLAGVIGVTEWPIAHRSAHHDTHWTASTIAKLLSNSCSV